MRKRVKQAEHTGTSNKAFRVLSLMIYAMFLLAMCIVLSNKHNLHVDGFFSYGLANQPYEGYIGMAPHDGTVYTPAANAWQEYLTVHADARFDYVNVWKNQSEDVHPPLYYVLLHTICSFFPGRFSIWFAAGINIAFAVLTLAVLRRILSSLGASETAVLLFSAAFALTAGFLSAVSLLRMYIMTMFWAALVCLLFLSLLHEGGAKKYAAVFAVCAAGGLTHYYFWVYLFFLCVVLGLYLLFTHAYRKLLALAGVTIASFAADAAIFPAMLFHIFAEDGDRGEESVQKLLHTQTAENLEKLRDYFGYVNDQLFGGILPVFLLVILCAVCYMAARHRKGSAIEGAAVPKADAVFPWILLTAPCLCYYILIARISVYTADRYIQPIYPIVFLSVTGLFLICAERLIRNRRLFVTVSGVLLLLAAVNGLRICPWEYLYREDADILRQLSDYGNYECVFIYDADDANARVQQSYFEISQYRSVTFVSDDNLVLLDQLACVTDNRDGLLVCIDFACPAQEVLAAIQASNPFFTRCTELGRAGLYTTTWFLDGE